MALAIDGDIFQDAYLAPLNPESEIQGPCVISIATPITSGVAPMWNQPIAQLLDPQTAMRNGSLAQTLSAGIDQANLMALARPVDAHKLFNLFCHAHALLSHHSHPGRRNERQWHCQVEAF